MTYAILCNPGHNRVYFEQSKLMAAAELPLVLPCARQPRLCELGGVAYLMFDCEPLTDEHLSAVAQLSFYFALFELRGSGDNVTLAPLVAPHGHTFDDNLITILKYTGKTNELFTRLLVGAALSACEARPDRFALFDPVAGKGTTLFEGLIRGFDVCGMEVGDKPVREGVAYLKKYLETSRVKHATHTERFSGHNKSFGVTRHTIDIAKTQHFELSTGNSIHADKVHKKGSFHLVAGDLPYGVQHGNVTGEAQSAMTRNPRELLTACLPSWRNLLCRGGGLALAWNTQTFPRADMVNLLQRNGFTVRGGNEFCHRVDNSIQRDIVRATKKD